MGKIIDVKLVCPVCKFITSVGEAEPDIDGDGNLGCPKCLLYKKQKVVMKEHKWQ